MGYPDSVRNPALTAILGVMQGLLYAGDAGID